MTDAVTGSPACTTRLGRSCRSPRRCLVKRPAWRRVRGLAPAAGARGSVRAEGAEGDGAGARRERAPGTALPSGARLRFSTGTDPMYLRALAAAL